MRTLRIQADHVLHGYEAVALRLMQTVSATTPHERVSRALATRLARDAEDLPETDRQLRRRFPDEPYRQRFGFIAERLRRTRAVLTGEPGAALRALRRADGLDAELAEIQEALVADGLERDRLGRGRRAALAGGDVRVPPRVARDPPAQRRSIGPRSTRSARSAAEPPRPRRA